MMESYITELGSDLTIYSRVQANLFAKTDIRHVVQHRPHTHLKAAAAG
jgi:hypothetical protein